MVLIPLAKMIAEIQNNGSAISKVGTPVNRIYVLWTLLMPQSEPCARYLELIAAPTIIKLENSLNLVGIFCVAFVQ